MAHLFDFLSQVTTRDDIAQMKACVTEALGGYEVLNVMHMYVPPLLTACICHLEEMFCCKRNPLTLNVYTYLNVCKVQNFTESRKGSKELFGV